MLTRVGASMGLLELTPPSLVTHTSGRQVRGIIMSALQVRKWSKLPRMPQPVNGRKDSLFHSL